MFCFTIDSIFIGQFHASVCDSGTGEPLGPIKLYLWNIKTASVIIHKMSDALCLDAGPSIFVNECITKSKSI